MNDDLRVALALLIIFGAAIVKGAIGFGFPLISVPLIANILDARSAVIILSVASLVGNAGILFRGGGSRATLRRLVPTLAGLGVGTIGGRCCWRTSTPPASASSSAPARWSSRRPPC